MRAHASAAQLINLVTFAPYVAGPLAAVADHAPTRPLRPDLRLPAAALAPFELAPTLPAEVRALPEVAALPPVLLALLGRAADRLRLAEITIVALQPVAYSLRLHLRRDAEQGQVLIYHNQAGRWSCVVAQGPQARLTDEARARLSEALPATVGDDDQLFPEELRLDVVAAYYRLQELAAQAGWTSPWSQLQPARLEVWFHDGRGLVLVQLHYGAGATPLHGEVHEAYSAAAAATAHDFLRLLVGPGMPTA